MDTREEIMFRLNQITLLLQEKRPELVDFMNEMPMTIPNETNPEINLQVLSDYYDSLTLLYSRV